MVVVSSVPKAPFSPACGFRPQTAMFGVWIPFLVRNWAVSLPMEMIFSLVSCVGTSVRGMWMVARPTVSVGPVRSIPVSSAASSWVKNSVWPG